MQSEPAPLDRIRIPRDQLRPNIQVGEGTPPAARHMGGRLDNGLGHRERDGMPAGVVKKVGGAYSANRPQVNRNAVNPVWWG